VLKVNEPNYINYTRIKTINAEEAQVLLSIFELRAKEFYNQEEFEKSRNDEMNWAYKALDAAFDSKDLRYTIVVSEHDDINDCCYYDQLGNMHIYFSNRDVQIMEFLFWAYKLKYNLPEILVAFIIGVECKESSDTQNVEYSNSTSTTESTGNAKIGGKPKGTLAEAVEHAYRKLSSHGNTAVLKANELRGFLKCLKEMATEGNENSDEYILERIESVKVPKSGSCTVTTKERQLRGSERKMSLPSKNYTNNAVSKLLAKLRTKHPLTL